MGSDRGVEHLEDARDLNTTAKTCPLCSIIANTFLDENELDDLDCVEERPILLSPRLQYKTRAGFENPMSNFSYSTEEHTTVIGMEVWIPTYDDKVDVWGDGYVEVSFRFFTDDDSPHTFPEVGCRLPVRNTGGKVAFSRLNQCINACQEHHDYCRETIGGSTLDKTEKPILPTRVIDIGPPGSRINPRLVCTNGSRGDYVALSHCWGKSQPIKTTKDTLQHHLEGIPWAEFPKTFQHAMRFTREIGLRYLWIDSLCIVQGDREEWLRVSEMMGSAYERAHLVVAAADASDSSVPYLDASGTAKGSLYMRLTSEVGFDEDPHETECPLSKRAWITQEWLLARRIVFYTRRGIVWSCRTIRSLPDGTNSWASRTRGLEWQQVIQQHASRDLTYFTDRLISLDGIGTELQKRFKVAYKHGMFEKDLQTQLMWRVEQGKGNRARRSENPIKTPSWSWASSMSKVEFYKDRGYSSPVWTSGRGVDCGDVVFEGDAIVVPQGKVMRLKPKDWYDGPRTRTTVYGANSSSESQNDGEDGHDESGDAEDDDSDGSVDYIDSDSTIKFDEDAVPDLAAGPLFALLLDEKHMSWSDNEEIFAQYYIVLQQCPGKPAHTYTRVGAGIFENDWRRSRARRFKNAKVRKIYIV